MVAAGIVEARIEPTLKAWRVQARQLLRANIEPRRVQWSTCTDDGGETLPGLFAEAPARPAGSFPEANRTPRMRPVIHAVDGAQHETEFRVPRDFLECAHLAALHSDPKRWTLLYTALWRITRGERSLMRDAADADVHALEKMARQVSRDAHKMKAFVRFRRIEETSGEHFVAFHRPDHHVLPLVGPFFQRRFNDMRWTILTPKGSLSWDGRTLRSGAPATRSPVNDDGLEVLWRTYYAAIFNPARIKIRAMKNEMPIRHWRTLPEAAFIPHLIAGADSRVRAMVASGAENESSRARDLLPPERSLPVLREAVQQCRACDIGCRATQAVFGEGPADAHLMFVGEQPGDQEDMRGRPFVGPAGAVFDDMLRGAGIDRTRIYLTNAVKHFKYTLRGKRRIHSKPDAREVVACKPWLEAELEIVKPSMLVLLGSTAAQALLGAGARVTRDRGRFFASPWSERTFITLHPSALLRMPDPAVREQAMEMYRRDFALIAERIQSLP